MIQTAVHASSAPALRLTLDVKKRSRQTLRFKAVKELAPAFEVLHTVMDGETVTRHWAPTVDLTISWDLAPGLHHLSIDCGGLWPAETISLPEAVASIDSIIPTIADVATGEPEPTAFWLQKGDELTNLTSVFSSAFVRNTHRKSLARFFSGARHLTAIPETPFFPVIYAESFAGTFAHSGLTAVSGQLFNSTPLVRDFSECFMGTPLTTLPPELFGETVMAQNFVRTFADTRLTAIPEELFASCAKGGRFTETFARTPVRQVPAELLSLLAPTDVDGMFEPPTAAPYDPMNIKTAAVFPAEFLRDTRNATGVLTKAFTH